jgi:hypothetical protein
MSGERAELPPDGTLGARCSSFYISAGVFTAEKIM